MSRDRTESRDRLPWLVVACVLLAQTGLGWFHARTEHARHLESALATLEASAEGLQTLLQINLQNAHYSELPVLLDRWLQGYESWVAAMRLEAATGYVFYDRELRPAAGRIRTWRVAIPYSYQGEATLTLVWDLSSVDRQRRQILTLWGLIELLTGATLVFFLRLAARRRRDTRQLAARAAELAAANQELKSQMEHRRRIERALAEEQRLLQVSLRSLGEGVVTIDEQGRVLLMNQAAEALLGLTARLCLGGRLDGQLELVNEEDGRPVPLSAADGGALGEGTIGPVTCRSPRPSDRLLTVSLSALRDEDDRFNGTVLVFRDVSKARQLEQERRRSSMLEALGVVAGGLAHDFNNILMAISGNISLAQDQAAGSGELAEILAGAEKATHRAAALTRQLLTFAKGGTPILETASIEQVIRDSAEFVLHGADLELVYDFSPGLLPVLIDKGQISQVIQNLVINARQASPTGGLLRISGRNQELDLGDTMQRRVIIQVSDHGTGIPADRLDHIFDPYYTTKAEGTGLGLAVVHSIVAQHHGRIEVESAEGRGTTFTLYLPASDAPTRLPEAPAGEIRRGSGRILVMDDDPAVRTITRRLIENLGYEVLVAEEGRQAVDLYREAQAKGRRPDAVVLDLTVPRGLGGLAALQRLNEVDPRVRAIVASGYSGDPVMACYREHGFRAALVKPFTLEKIGQVLEAVLVAE